MRVDERTWAEPDRPGAAVRLVARGPLARAAVALVSAPIRWYRRFVSPLLPPRCRYHPTCSRYALACLQTHGVVVGAWFAARRLARCSPWFPGGYDPPPPPGARPFGSPPSRDGARPLPVEEPTR